MALRVPAARSGGDGYRGLKRPAVEQLGVVQNKDKWEGRVYRTISGYTYNYLGLFASKEEAARASDFAELTLRAVEGLPTVPHAATNFNASAYYGADGALRPLEAVLPGLQEDMYQRVRDRLATAIAALRAAYSAADSGSSSESDSESNSGSGSESDSGGDSGGNSRGNSGGDSGCAGQALQQQQQQQQAKRQARQQQQQQQQLLMQQTQQKVPPPLPPPAPPAHGVLPALGLPRDYRTKKEVLQYLCELKTAVDMGGVTQAVFETEYAQGMSDLRARV
ncbi:hypothetical protein FOA52_008919 [Chlamydomonas sp. UWO 241]|nr:hypothetical protein FOA52_008919 [Chlamydomonas sp. UWO 241]